MQESLKIGRSTLASVALVAVVVGGAAFLGALAARAAPGGATRNTVSFAGRLDGTTGPQRLTFRFKHGTKEICAPEVGVEPDATGSFHAEIPLDDCPATLFDGSDVALDVDVGASIVVKDQPVSPVPYAKYADRIGAVEGDLVVKNGDVLLDETHRIGFKGATGTIDSDVSAGDDYIALRTGETERLYVARSGDVGIGTTNPGYLLHLRKDHASGTDVYVENQEETSPGAYARVGVRVGGGAGSLLVNGPNHSTEPDRMVLDGGSGLSQGMLLRTDVGDIVLEPTPPYDVGIGTRSPQYTLDVAGDIRATGSVTQSDGHLKKDIAPIADAAARVSRLRAVRFRWKDRSRGEDPRLGVIAQEVEAVVPEAVTTAGDGIKSVRQEALVALLVEAVKSQQHEIDELKRALGTKRTTATR